MPKVFDYQECGLGGFNCEIRKLFDTYCSQGKRRAKAWPTPRLYDHCMSNSSEFRQSCDEPIGGKSFVKRAQKTDLSYPIIVITEVPIHGFFIADGMHRLWKAHGQNQLTMQVFEITWDEFCKIATREEC